ncbi:hypothetical protein [Aliarcobacter butzleri]|uniref:hypothetical protein n=1 Tax=Aliarcobacter butzleri TaxID=28197 RepID=UPI00125EA114|nr:hypothetical protein [Aliarcobacter butzleri]
MVFPLNQKRNITVSKPKPKSQGYLKDLAYINMAGSFFTNAQSDILKENHYITKKINEDLDLLLQVKKELIFFSTSITDLISSPVHLKEDSLKFDKYCETLKKEFLKIAHNKAVSFELLGCWILYSRFFNSIQDKPKSFDRSFSFIVDKMKILNLAGMVLELEKEEYHTEWDLSYKLSKVL